MQHNCYRDPITVQLIGDGFIETTIVCRASGAILSESREEPAAEAADDPFEPYAEIAWSGGDGMDDVHRVMRAWNEAGDAAEGQQTILDALDLDAWRERCRRRREGR